MKKKRLDLKTLELLNLDKSKSDRYFEYDAPITRVQIRRVEYGGQGSAPFYAIFYSRDDVLTTVSVKGNVVSTTLTIGVEDEDGDICVDPRIIATYILGAWLDFMFEPLEDEGYNAEFDLTDALNPVFTRKEALDWLERCGFIGLNNYHNPFRVEDKTKWYIDDPTRPGYDIYWDEPEIQYAHVPPKAKPLYDEYIGAYREWKRKAQKQADLHAKWVGKPKNVLQAELDRLYEKGDDETIELFEAEFGYLLEDDDFNGKVGDFLIKE